MGYHGQCWILNVSLEGGAQKKCIKLGDFLIFLQTLPIAGNIRSYEQIYRTYFTFYQVFFKLKY